MRTFIALTFGAFTCMQVSSGATQTFCVHSNTGDLRLVEPNTNCRMNEKKVTMQDGAGIGTVFSQSGLSIPFDHHALNTPLYFPLTYTYSVGEPQPIDGSWSQAEYLSTLMPNKA